MDLKVKSSASGYCPGPNAGVADETIYFCPCGKGEIVYKKRDNPDFHEFSWEIRCDICAEKYEFEKGELKEKP